MVGRRERRRGVRGRPSWEVLLAVVVGVVLGAVVGRAAWPAGSGAGREASLQELAGRERERLEEATRLIREQVEAEKQVALSQFFRLQAFLRFADMGLETAWVVPVSATDPDPLSTSSGAANARLPRLALDPEARSAWRDLAGRLEALEGGVDERVYETFRSVRAFVEERPFPGEGGLAAARRAGWTEPDVVGRWMSLNRALRGRAAALLEES